MITKNLLQQLFTVIICLFLGSISFSQNTVRIPETSGSQQSSDPRVFMAHPTVRMQILYKASEFGAFKGVGGDITSIDFYIYSNQEETYDDLTVKMSHVNASSLTTTWETSGTTVYGPADFTISGTYDGDPITISLDEDFYFNGLNNVLVEISYTITSANSVDMDADDAGFDGWHYYYEKAAKANTNAVTSDRPDILFSFSSVGGGPTPVELTSFEGNYSNQAVNLEWMTASEMNNAEFVVLKGESPNDLKALATIAGAGNSCEIMKYSYRDHAVKSGIYYYQLKQVDFDGTEEYLKTISVACEDENLQIDAYPNPFKNSLRIVLSEQASNAAEIEVCDMTGTVVRKITTLHLNSNELFLDNLESLNSGVYVLRFKDKGRIISKKIIKK